jgi:hypothetical protein
MKFRLAQRKAGFLWTQSGWGSGLGAGSKLWLTRDFPLLLLPVE